MSDLMSNEESVAYIGTFNGKFTRKVAEGTEGAITRTNKNGKVVTEVQFNVINGILTDIKERDSEFGKRYAFVFQAGDDKLQLESSQKSNIATTIINRLPNLDISKAFKLKIVYNVSKERSMLFVDQDGENIEDYFQHWDGEKKEWVRKHKYPAWKQVEVNGEKVWDSSEQIEYGKKVIKKFFTDVSIAPEPAPEAPQEEETDDLPF